VDVEPRQLDGCNVQDAVAPGSRLEWMVADTKTRELDQSWAAKRLLCGLHKESAIRGKEQRGGSMQGKCVQMFQRSCVRVI
jgi:hypothetical protein